LGCYAALGGVAAYFAAVVFLPIGLLDTNQGAVVRVIVWLAIAGASVAAALYAWRVANNQILHISVLVIGLTHVLQGVVQADRHFALAASADANAAFGHSIVGALSIVWAFVGTITAIAGASGWLFAAMNKPSSKP
jgi:hypothetical protein